MKILLVGGGGREHALAWKISQSPLVETIFATPGNDAIAALPKTSCTKDAPLALAQHTGFDLVVIGPEHPLCDGLADQLRARGILVYGPDAAGARLEGSKVYAKQCMHAWDIPTAAFEIGHSLDEARRHLAGWPVETDGVVVKADGLAAGKGVVVTHHRAEAERTLHDFFANPDSPIRAKAVVLERLLCVRLQAHRRWRSRTEHRRYGRLCPARLACTGGEADRRRCRPQSADRNAGSRDAVHRHAVYRADGRRRPGRGAGIQRPFR